MSTLGWILIGVGAVLGAMLPKSDRRFRTGYKDTRVPSGKHILATFGFLGAGVLFIRLAW